MAISTGAAVLAGSLVSAGTGVAGSKAAGKAAEGMSREALDQQQRQFDLSREDLAPWQQAGQAALLKLGQALGLEGYRTSEEIAHNEFLKTKPTGPGHVEGMGKTATEKLTRASPSAKALADTPLEALGGFGAVSQGQAKRKRAKFLAAEKAAAQAKYEQDLQAWQLESDRLQGLSDASLANYDPAAASRSMLESDPSYQFRLGEGEKALNRSIAATTGVLQPGASKELLKYGSDYASNEWGNYISRLAQTAGLGQAAATTQSGVSQNAGVANSNILQSIGSSKAGAINNAYGSVNNAVQGGLSNYISMNQYDSLLNNKTATN